MRATRAVAREVRSRAVAPAAVEPAVGDAATRAGLDRSRVDVVDAAVPFAFTYGLLCPRVAVSTRIAAITTPRELQALFAHEREHMRGRDPLRTLVTDILTVRHAVLPLLGHLRTAFVADRELTADRRAVTRCGTGAVAGALLKVTDTPPWASGAPAAAMGVRELLDVRITQLEAGEPPVRTPPARWRVAASAAGVATYAWALAGSAILIAATPLACTG
ncbi:M56 family metallopeptidase [Streptomyces gobiensis]|uniref:M56 family metallopeptidase n=1 Tax=Streptomyces gobiensis TaxID=2875706 RepID=UPI001E423DEA|nr:M56 family metallopeptidase [Streptomyces gobiensis]UGY91287.1 M56 family metallopeptidase [Streptomyces gobiensis]